MPQRSPVTFWLLLAATLAVDIVAWTAAESPHGPHWELMYDALIVGQLGVVCIWSSLQPTKNPWTRALPWLAAIIASVAGVGFGERPHVWDGLPYYGLHAALLLMVLWLLQRTGYWQQRTGSTGRWKFSVAELLIVMTVVAVLGAAMRGSRMFDDPWPQAAIFICGTVAVAAASVVSWSRSSHTLIRLAGSLGAAIALGVAVALGFSAIYISSEFPTPAVVIIFAGYYLVQAVTLAVWIGVGQVLPPRLNFADDEALTKSS